MANNTSQLPVEAWYNFIDEPTLADAIMDRLTASAHRMELQGKSVRNKNQSLVYFRPERVVYFPRNIHEEKKTDFSHHIQYWGSKSTITRKDFTNIQENIFIALIAKTDIDLIALEKGDLDEDEAVKLLIKTMESYTNGGLILIREKLEEIPNYFLQPTSFLNMILEIETS